MGEEREGRDGKSGEPVPCPATPKDGQREAGETEREVIVQKTHAEGIAIGEDRYAGSENPRGAFRNGGHEGENAPEEDQDRSGDDDFLSSVEAKKIAEVKEGEVGEDVIPLADDV